MKGVSLSVVVITLNEERNIGRCLKSLDFSRKAFGKPEVLVVDAGSQDRTVVLARQLGAKVLARPWKGYADQKNWAFGQTKGGWILSLDADEELTPGLIREIEEKIGHTPREVDGYFLKRRAFFLGEWISHCGWWPDAQLRLIRRGKGKFTNKPVHEGLEVKGQTLELDEPMNHYTYETIRQYLKKMNRYSDLFLLDAPDKKKRFWWAYLAFMPGWTFFKMYILKLGFLDGWRGLTLCGLSAFHDFVKYAKLWEKEVLKIDR
jgi:glycosyltransferase involved in cell wall biosynthesis